MLSVAVAIIVTMPVTVALVVGAVMATVGAVESDAGVAAVTVAEGWERLPAASSALTAN